NFRVRTSCQATVLARTSGLAKTSGNEEQVGVPLRTRCLLSAGPRPMLRLLRLGEHDISVSSQRQSGVVQLPDLPRRPPSSVNRQVGATASRAQITRSRAAWTACEGIRAASRSAATCAP